MVQNMRGRGGWLNSLQKPYPTRSNPLSSFSVSVIYNLICHNELLFTLDLSFSTWIRREEFPSQASVSISNLLSILLWCSDESPLWSCIWDGLLYRIRSNIILCNNNAQKAIRLNLYCSMKTRGLNFKGKKMRRKNRWPWWYWIFCMINNTTTINLLALFSQVG